MKVAELYAELGFKFDGLDQLQAVEKSLQGIAAAARNAALAMKILARTHVPTPLRPATPRAPGPAATAAAIPAAAGAGPGQAPRRAAVTGPGWSIVPTNPNFIGPVQPAGSQGPQQSVWQGLKSLAQLGLKIGGIATVAMAIRKLVSALTEWMRSSMQASIGTQLFTRRTGQTQQTLKQWELASTKAGLAQEEAAQNLEMLTRKAQEVAFTGEGVSPFNILGISPFSSPTDIFKAFQTRTAKMSPAQAQFFGEQIGFTRDWSAFLHNFKGALPDVAGILPKQQDLEAVSKLNEAWQTLRFTMEQLGQKILSDLAPALTTFLNGLTNLTKFLGWGADRDKSVQSMSQAYMGQGGLLPTSLRSFGNTNSTSINAPVTITGVSDPKEVKRLFDQSFDKITARAYYQRTPPLAP